MISNQNQTYEINSWDTYYISSSIKLTQPEFRWVLKQVLNIEKKTKFRKIYAIFKFANCRTKQLILGANITQSANTSKGFKKSVLKFLQTSLEPPIFPKIYPMDKIRNFMPTVFIVAMETKLATFYSPPNGHRYQVSSLLYSKQT